MLRRKAMSKQLPAVVVLSVVFAAGTAYAQECLHGAAESSEQAARRREALAATRHINTIEINQPGAVRGQYLRHEELAGAPYALKMRESTDETVKRLSLAPGTEILPNWQLTLDVTPKGYWLMIKDKADPCGFAFISNQAGMIFHAEPIR
jgi:hypothetical protein